MPSVTFHYETEAERLSLERAFAFLHELRSLALTAAPGTVLDACEGHALDKGRELLLGSLEDALRARVAEAEKKGVPRGTAPARRRCATRAGTRAT